MDWVKKTPRNHTREVVFTSVVPFRDHNNFDKIGQS